jgi:hypothetical protein
LCFKIIQCDFLYMFNIYIFIYIIFVDINVYTNSNYLY